MKLQSKIAALFCAGLLTASLFAVPVSAATTTNTDTTNIQYVSGAISTDENNTTNHLIVLPADITYVKGSDPAANFNIMLLTKDGSNFLNTVNVNVKAYTQNGLTLKNDTAAPGITGSYSVSWGANNLTADATTEATAQEAVTFTVANFAGIVNTNTQEQTGTVTLAQTEMDKMEVAKKGTAFSDVVTFVITDTTA